MPQANEVVNLSNLEDALQFLGRYAAGEETTPEVRFSGELGSFKTSIDGERYKSTVPAELARGLVELQDSLNRAVAFALYQVEDIRKLTVEQKQCFELVFSVKEGSTEVVAPLDTFLKKLAEGLSNMSDAHKVITIVAVAIVLTTGYVALGIMESSTATKKAEIQANVQISSDAEKTAQFRILADLVGENKSVKRFSQAAEEGSRAIIRGAPDASSITLGRAKFSSTEIKEVNQRAAKVRSIANVIQGDYRIFGTESRHDGSTRYTLSGVDALEFPVIVDHTDFTEEELNRLWTAAKDRKTVKLEVNLTMNKGVIRTAQITQVL